MSETVREGRRPPPGWRRRYLMVSSWFAVFTGRRMNSNVEGVPLPGWLCVPLSSVRLAQRGGVSAATQQEALCVCVHTCAGFEASTEKALYLRYSVPTLPPSVSRSLFLFKGVSRTTDAGHPITEELLPPSVKLRSPSSIYSEFAPSLVLASIFAKDVCVFVRHPVPLSRHCSTLTVQL